LIPNDDIADQRLVMNRFCKTLAIVILVTGSVFSFVIFMTGLQTEPGPASLATYGLTEKHYLMAIGGGLFAFTLVVSYILKDAFKKQSSRKYFTPY